MTGPHESFNIRRATSADIAALSRVHLAGWQVGYRGLLPDSYLDNLSVSDNERRWGEWLAQGGRTLVAERASTVFAFSSVGLVSDDDDADPATGELRALYADPAAWGTGAGRAVHDAALAALRAAGSTQATLWTFPTNARAIAFYERQGWLPDGVRKADTSRGFRLEEIRFRRGVHA
ncbi:MAG: GNAT family N-acetyltransferase [Actinomycetota bacterium]|nr:GNAT family N-acetyltransferase [Actinomycetota bacterium]